MNPVRELARNITSRARSGGTDSVVCHGAFSNGVNASIRVSALLIFLAAVFSVLVGVALRVEAVGENAFTDGEIIDLVRPGTVRVIQHVRGTAVYEPFFIDLNTFNLYTNPERSSVRISFDEYVVGSGVLASPGGYILTLAGTAGRAGAEMKVVSGIARGVLEDEVGRLDQVGLAEFEKVASEEAHQSLLRALLLRIRLEGVTSEIRVVDPKRSEGEIPEIFGRAIPAQVIREGEPFGEEYDAYVVLKIEKENLPALPLENILGGARGGEVYAFQFKDPERDEESRILAAELKRGTLDLSKQGNVFKTPITLNDSSRSGPIVDGLGVVRGLASLPLPIVYRSPDTREVVFIPIDLARNILEAAGVRVEPGEYYTHLKNGLEYLHERSCDAAIQSFEKAKKATGDFVSGNAADSYIHTCSELIERGNSLDTIWDFFTEFFGRLGSSIWLLLFGALVTVLLIASVALRLKKEEAPQQPSQEESIYRGFSGSAVFAPRAEGNGAAHLGNTEIARPQPTRENGDGDAPREESTLGPEKIDRYVVNMKDAGMSEDSIIEQLQHIGFSQEQIYEAVVRPHFKSR